MESEFFSALIQLEREKGINKERLIEDIKRAILSAYKKKFGKILDDAEIELDSKTGKTKILIEKVVRETVHNDSRDISLIEARKIDPDLQIGDKVKVEFNIKSFGRITAQAAKQVITQRIREEENNIVCKEFNGRIGTIITGIVQKVDHQGILVDLGKSEGIVPPREQIPNETYKVGDRLKAYIYDVERTKEGILIILSRTYPVLIRKLFEMEVPEMQENIIKITHVSRDPGFRSKIAVVSTDANIDPVGSCVGIGGTRVQAVINELSGEKIDIIPYNEDPKIFIKNAISPATAKSVDIINLEKRLVQVVVPDNQLSIAIGKDGRNVRLAVKLTGWHIDIKSESEWLKEMEEKSSIEIESQSKMPVPPVKSKDDDLSITELASVGPKLAERLRASGITTLGDLAKLELSQLLAIPQIGKITANKLYQDVRNR